VSAEAALWQFFSELSRAVEAANRGVGKHPYVAGHFMVVARGGDVELTITDISEEDAVLIKSELEAAGVTVVLRGSVRCPRCRQRVPQQAYCVNCRAKLARNP
jgi:hypothetical protein